MRQQRGVALSSILLTLLSALIGWVLFVTALIVDIATEVQYPSNYAFGPEAAAVIRPASYLFVAAVAVFALGSLWALKRLERALNPKSQNSNLLVPAHGFTGTAIVISLVLAAWLAVAVFFSSFFEIDPVAVPLDVRIWNTYVPIVLYTALVVSVLLSAFVFGTHQFAKAAQPQPPEHSVATSNTATFQDEPDARQRRFIAFAFAVPIIAVAVALISGLIVFDVTETALEAWIWASIQVVIAAGIITGTWFARRAFDAMNAASLPKSGVAVGAKNLNFVLSIVFASVVSLMSIGYGASAVEQLRIAPSLSLNVYENQPNGVSSSDVLDVESAVISMNGSDLERLSTVTLVLNPGNRELLSGESDRDGLFWAEEEVPQDLEPGSYTVEVTAVAADQSELKRTLAVAVRSNGTISLPDGETSSDGPNLQPRMVPITAGWFFTDLLPAFLLLVLASSAVAATLSIRNREHAPDAR